MKGKVIELSASEAWAFLEPRHYAGRKPSISCAYGWEIDSKLVAVCTFGKPASPSLCRGICGAEFATQVYELNRLCRVDELKEPLSQFVGACLRRLRAKDWIIVSYSDTAMHHNGYIYQACNFLYTDQTKPRTDMYTPGGKHSRHYKSEQQGLLRRVRSAKNRYVYFATAYKPLRKQWRQALKYPVLPYPKEANQNYELGHYLPPEIITQDPEDAWML